MGLLDHLRRSNGNHVEYYFPSLNESKDTTPIPYPVDPDDIVPLISFDIWIYFDRVTPSLLPINKIRVLRRHFKPGLHPLEHTPDDSFSLAPMLPD